MVKLFKLKYPFANMFENRSVAERDAAIQWFFTKLTFGPAAVAYLIFCLYRYHTVHFPKGICMLLNCSVLLQFPVREITAGLLIGATILYLFEKAMLPATSVLFVFALLVLSVDESNGNPAENGIITLLFFVQMCAYAIHFFNPKSPLYKNRIQFSLQIAAAVYVLAGISKLTVGGIAWFTRDAPLFVLEVKRKYYTMYTATGNIYYAEHARQLACWINSHPLEIKFALLATVVIELSAFAVIIWRQAAIWVGLLLVLMHVGIFFIMGIFFPTVVVPMLAIMVNPLYWIFVAAMKVFALSK
jgi:hypothetical protein